MSNYTDCDIQTKLAAVIPIKTLRLSKTRLAVSLGLKERILQHVHDDQMDYKEKEVVAEPYYKRLKYELDVIEDMGYSGYFLIVADFIKWSKNQNIPVGPG